MKQHSLPWQTTKRDWRSTTRPWNELGLSLADEARARKKAPETTVELSVKVPLRFINAMPRHGLLTDSQAERRDEQAITEALLATVENRLYGKVRASRYV